MVSWVILNGGRVEEGQLITIEVNVNPQHPLCSNAAYTYYRSSLRLPG